MLEIPKRSRTAAVLVFLLVAAYFAARHLVPGDGGTPADAPTYPARQASEHVGEYARVCGTVVDAAYRPRVGGAPTFLNFGRPYPDQLFTALVWGDDRGRFDVPPESAYAGRAVCVTGFVESHEGRTEIVVDDPSKITPAPRIPGDAPSDPGP